MHENESSFARHGRPGRPSPRESCADKTTGTQLYSSANRALANCNSSSLNTATAARIGAALLADAPSHLHQDTMDFRLLLVQQSHQLVVLFDGFEGFDKDSLAAGTGTVHHTLHSSFLLDLDRNYEALAANRDQFVLHRATFGQPPQIAPQRILDRASLPFDLAANAGKFRRGLVVECAIGQNLVTKRSQEFGEVRDRPTKAALLPSTRTSSQQAGSRRFRATRRHDPP